MLAVLAAQVAGDSAEYAQIIVNRENDRFVGHSDLYLPQKSWRSDIYDDQL
jgi:hypothetical protein